MRRLCRSVTGVALLAALASGCGSNAGDSLTMRFVSFDGVGLTQADSVRETSADVDAVQGACLSGTTLTGEPYTQTIVNATFINEEAADINLQGYRVFIPIPGLPNFVEQTISRNLRGGRCANIDRQCVDDADCGVAGILGSCVHSPTTVAALVLFDFTTKDQIKLHPELFGTATNITIQFFGTDDANQSFEVTTSYVATFGNFDNCPSGSTEVPVP
jgi:hypothetical protein